jgi:hypothetical protein
VTLMTFLHARCELVEGGSCELGSRDPANRPKSDQREYRASARWAEFAWSRRVSAQDETHLLVELVARSASVSAKTLPDDLRGSP